MKLENQVCSLEIAKKLEELGVNKESLFYWVVSKDHSSIHLGVDIQLGNIDWDEMYSAYTVAELGKMLPRQICDKDQNLSGVKGKCYGLVESFLYNYGNAYSIDGFQLQYGDTKVKIQSKNLDDSPVDYWIGTEADVRAIMLIYLLENKLI